ncbi:hypothetical protein PGT21_003456 [Puccinia graminis f. sp. tritici]|uniref:RRP12 HEAT domain-containing protein n=1 Tax=Puccinia graminis f. sp. tritici TaxID=56615 RepID=A0A5B0MT19_PUCGR|nr:hypothetical protein PGT21_003456 [Puccinia graminis f. sp. tritici]
MEEQLRKLRGHFNGTQASIARLLEAIESTIDQREPSDYYHAIISTIRATTTAEDQTQIRTDSLYLLAIIISHLKKPILQDQTQTILELINSQPFNTQNQPLLKSILSILQPIYLSFNSSQLNSTNLQAIAQPLCLKKILPLIISEQPKLRRAAQAFISQLISQTPPTPLRTHPYQQPIINYTFKQLQQHPTTTTTTTTTTTQSILISLFKFIQTIINSLDQQQLEQQLIPTSFTLINTHTENPFLTNTILNTIQTIFTPTNNKLEPTQILSIINQIIQLNNTNNPAQLNALEHAWICLARLDSELSTKELPKIGQLSKIFNNFSHPAQETRTASQSFLSAICRYCITDQEIQSTINNHQQNKKNHSSSSSSSLELILSSILSGLTSTDVIAFGGTIELIEVLKSLVIRLPRSHKSDHPPAILLKDHILALDKLRSTRLGLGPMIDESLTCISQICGPSFLLDTLPLNLNLEDQPQSATQPGRAWLLTVIKVFNSSLAHFIHYFVPLSEKLFEKKRNTLKLANASSDQKFKQNCLLQLKIYDTLIEQIWRLLPGYSDLPWDLELAFNRSFAELLTQVIYSQPSLRPPIFNSLKVLIDKTLVLTKRSIPNNTDKINEFGFDPHSHLNHLRSFAPNFLSVLFNVYNSSYDTSNSSQDQQPSVNSNRGYMVDCMRSLLEIISEKELNESYQKIKNLLDQSIKSKSPSTVTTQKMLDLLTVLLPRLITSTTNEQGEEGHANKMKRLKEIQGLISQDQFILASDSNLQKKSFKLLTTFLELVCQRGLVKEAIDDLDGLIAKLLALNGKGKVSGPAKRDRALLVSSLVSVIPVDKLHHIPRLLTEVVLGCKEANADVRGLSYEVLIKIGNKMKEHGGKVDWKALVNGMEDDEDQEPMDDGEQEASIEEYFKMISAGLAGTSPHMVSATIAALSRVLFEFHDELNRTTIDELISTIEIFLNSPNREIAKTAIGFMKVAVVSLKREVVSEQLEKIVPGLLKWAAEHKNYFKTNIQNLLERLLRLFGFDTLEKFVSSRDENDGGRKLVYSLVKKQKKKKLLRQSRAENPVDEDQAGQDDDESDQDRPVRQARLGDAYEEALYGSESSDDEGEDDDQGAHKAGGPHKGANQKQTKKNRKNRDGKSLDNQLLEDDEDQIMDLLDGGRLANRALAGKEAKAEKRKQELKRIGAGYKKDSETGKMIIDEEESSQNKSTKNGNDESTNAFLEAVHGADGFRRDARGNVKANKKRKLDQDVVDRLEQDEEQQLDIQDAVHGLQITDDQKTGSTHKKKKTKRVKEKLGSEFKAKKAGGDKVTRNKDGQEISPFAYLPLQSLNSKKKKLKVTKTLNITGKVKGSAS